MKKMPTTKKEFLFGSKNYRMLLISVAVIAFGFFLMAGGGSDDPSVFNPAIFNFQRIRLAPSLVPPRLWSSHVFHSLKWK